MSEQEKRYFLKSDHLDAWTEVTQEEFISAELSAGFYSKGGPGTVATGGFHGKGIAGRVVYPVNYDYYARYEPTFHALLVPEAAPVGRVSVDAGALAALIEYADAQRGQVDDEFCVSQSERDASGAQFAALVAALAQTEATP